LPVDGPQASDATFRRVNRHNPHRLRGRGPPGVAAGAAAGGAVGYLTGEAVGIPRDEVERMRASLTPNSSALIVVLNDQWVHDVERNPNQAHARAVISNKIAGNQTPSK
jgi:uncharacterized protein DUF1269